MAIGWIRVEAARHAVKDFLTPPEIHTIEIENYTGAPGEIIRIRATDDFKVVSVSVRITMGNGIVIEKGEAQPWGKRGLWRYITTKRSSSTDGTVIAVVAKDLADNKTVASLTYSDKVGEQRWSQGDAL